MSQPTDPNAELARIKVRVPDPLTEGGRIPLRVPKLVDPGPVSPWRKTAEMPPPRDRFVFVHSGTGVSVEHLGNSLGRWIWWMPIPELPKEAT